MRSRERSNIPFSCLSGASSGSLIESSNTQDDRGWGTNVTHMWWWSPWSPSRRPNYDWALLVHMLTHLYRMSCTLIASS